MPGQVLSDADVFGASSTTPSGPQTLSDADVFGSGLGAPKARAPRSDASIAWGGAKAGLRATARSVADFGDMLLSVPGMAMGTAADVTSRIQSIFEGVPHPAASRIAKQVRESMTEKFSPTLFRSLTELAIKAISPDKKRLEPTDVQKGMQTISKGFEKGGKWVEEKTKGAINAEDFDSLVNEVMAVGGLRGGQAGAERIGKAMADRADGKAPPPPPPPETPAAAAAQRDVKADIEAATGINREFTNPKAAQKAKSMRRAAARAAFKEDPQYADYLRNYAEGEAQAREAKPFLAPGGEGGTGFRTPRTGLREGQILLDHEVFGGSDVKLETGQPSSLESALQKTAKGQRFNLTADELAALNKASSQYGRPTILDKEGKPLQGGAVDQDLLKMIAGLGLTGALALYAYNNSDPGSLVAAGAAGMFFGERGAANHARAARGAELANDMLKHGVDPDKVRLATGWSLGKYDKKWRYELDDSKASLTDEFEKLPESKLFSGDQAKLSLDKAIDHPELFQTYPELKGVSVVKRKGFLDFGGLQGWFNPESNELGITPYAKEPLSTMLHEIQHWIQEKEGFARGGNESMVFDAMTDKQRQTLAKDVMTKLQQRADQSTKDVEGFKRAIAIKDLPEVEKLRQAEERWSELVAKKNTLPEEEYKRLANEAINELDNARGIYARKYFNKEVWDLSDDERLALIRATKRGSEDLPKRMKLAEERAVKSLEQLGKIRAGDAEALKKAINETGEAHSLYRKIAGEIEARDTQARQKFSPEERRITPPGSSESIDPKDAIVVYSGDGKSFSLDPSLKGRPPTKKVAPRQEGKADPASLAALAAFVGGAVAMQAWSDNPSLVKDAVAGLMLAAATSVRPGALLRLVRESATAKPLESIGKAAEARVANLQLASLDIANTVRKIGKLVPDDTRRIAVHEALDKGSTAGLSPKEVEAFNLLKGEYTRLLTAGREAGVLQDAMRDYATHIVKADRSLIDRLLGAQTTYGTSPHTPYELARKFRTLAAGEAAGVQYVKDAAFVYATYARSIASAAENARLLKTIKGQRTAGGDKLMAKADEAPSSYVRIDNPQLRGMAVHPEIASQMKFIFENPSSAGIPTALEIIADVSKRSAVSASLFHTKALIDSLIGSVPLTPKAAARAAAAAAGGYALASTFGDDHALREAALLGTLAYALPQLGYMIGRGKFLDEVRKGSNSELVTRATKAGLTFGTEKGSLVVDDSGRRFYDAMKGVQKLVDTITQPVGIKGGKGVEAYIKANHAMDDALWGRLHPGMKLEVWSKTSEILRESSIARNARNPKSRILSQAEADSIAADFANDQFGGLNWTKIAMESQTRLGRVVAQSLLSPKGRQAMRIAMFAPDWTISTARAALAAVDKDLINPLKWGNVAQGMFQPMTRDDLARQYIARSALYYLVVGDAINYSMSGHHLWENKDWSFIDWGDGRRMQFSKHVMEVPHWFDKPLKQGIGKMGYVPKEAMNQMFGTEYLAPREGKYGQVFAGPKMRSGRLEHAARGFEPIPFQSAGDPETFLWGFAGMPLYGMTEEQKAEAKRKREEERRNK